MVRIYINMINVTTISMKDLLSYEKERAVPPYKTHPYIREIESYLKAQKQTCFRVETSLCFDLQDNRIILRYQENYIYFHVGFGPGTKALQAYENWSYGIACEKFADLRIQKFINACERLKLLFAKQTSVEPTSSGRYGLGMTLRKIA